MRPHLHGKDWFRSFSILSTTAARYCYCSQLHHQQLNLPIREMRTLNLLDSKHRFARRIVKNRCQRWVHLQLSWIRSLLSWSSHLWDWIRCEWNLSQRSYLDTRIRSFRESNWMWNYHRWRIYGCLCFRIGFLDSLDSGAWLHWFLWHSTQEVFEE